MIKTIIVDDEVLARIGIQTFLEKHENISVENTFSLAGDALEYLKNNRAIDIVITDIEMSEMNGLDFIREIREQKLANEIIIVSCHDNFNYARQAMELGADYYILKQEINEEKLIQTIEKAYEEKIASIQEIPYSFDLDKVQNQVIQQELGYIIGVLKLKGQYDINGNLLPVNVDESMVINLIDNIVKKDNMGTLFTPYKKDMFILFQFPKIIEEQEREKLLKSYCDDLVQNIQIFINGKLLVGYSNYFVELQKVREKYEEASNALKRDFYFTDRYLFSPNNNSVGKFPELQFSSDKFLDEGGIDVFKKELEWFIANCREYQVDVEWLKRTLIIKLNILVYQVIHEYIFSDELMKKWDEKFQNNEVMQSQDHQIMIERIFRIMKQFQSDLLYQIRKDNFNEVLQFINEHIQEEISLTEVANLNCMSIAHFCKKFKERTGLTLIGYVNQKKVEQIKYYLKTEQYSLEQIAEFVGFQNVNYMVRLFKKVTGMTIREFRKNSIGYTKIED
ncbi:response regulator transcription factor [Anaerocolumna sp. MB42-C2]|uniref:response regulator transcription factor n=1 Tax=Anaerocolumna sp. MB42-C2 TaxID=3070997 RepID=UPI0027E0D419|nr:response regulator [Anaerocolumna sp. MB42-C2]WMJ89948.1 response regulator [Anaerocolumna sp. MB42-C2]